mgnify:FL=1
MGTSRLDDISILRVLCILVVVFFHCYGMMYADAHFPDTVSMYESLYFIPNQCVFINIAMPMFVFVSGYLFQYLLFRGKYPTWGNLLQKKGIRILLPYFVFGLFFMATTSNWHPLQLLNGGYWHLWFLPMLFWSFILEYSVYKLKLKVYGEIALLLICLAFVPKNISICSEWFYWFYCGALICKYKDFLFGTESNHNRDIFYLFILLISIVFLVFFPVYYGKDISTWYSKLKLTGCIISIFYFMNRIDWSKYKMTEPIVKFSAYSFGIYIWHNWVAVMLISKTSQRIFGLPELAANHVILFPLCFSLVTLTISWTLSWMMMKTKAGRFLIG